MDVTDFTKDAKPREIFVYTCQRIAEPLIPLGFKYRKSRNDIVKSDERFRYLIGFQPSIKSGSTSFLMYVGVESDELAAWRLGHPGHGQGDTVLRSWLWAITNLDPAIGLPGYEIHNPAAREQTIAKIAAQIEEYVLPFFARFQNPENLAAQVRSEGFLPHRRKRYGIDKAHEADFCDCFGVKGD